MNEKTILYLVRHGQTEWNQDHRLQGHMDSPLTALGIQQAEWLAESLREVPIDVIVSSPSRRAVHTAEILRDVRDLPIHEYSDLKEICLGVWEGQTQKAAEASDPVQFYNFWNDPEHFKVEGSETFEEVAARAVSALKGILASYQGKSILIVSHTVVVKTIMAFFEGRILKELWNPPYIHPTCLSKIELTGEAAEIIMHGDIRHYKDEALPG